LLITAIKFIIVHYARKVQQIPAWRQLLEIKVL